MPTAARSGEQGDNFFRLLNLIKRGRGSQSYWESAGGPENLSEPATTETLTGTISMTANSRTVTGSGTLFTTELRAGQWFLTVDTTNHRSFLCAVERIASNTELRISRAPNYDVTNMLGYYEPVIFAVNNQRGMARRGNVVRYDKGTYFGVGAGEFKINGASLSAPLILKRKPQISTLSGGIYTHSDLGLPDANVPVLTAVAEGVKGMQAAQYGVVVTRERIETVGFGNPSEPASVTITAGQRIKIDFGEMDGPSKQNGWGIWGTRLVDAADASGKNYLNGPWFRVMNGSGPNGMVIAADLAQEGGQAFITEWLDAEIEANDLVTFDNDPPPDAEFIGLFNNVPVWISCDGPGSTSPGIRLFPAKPSNIEAAPAGLAYPTSPPEEILGVFSALGRLFLLTPNHLQVTVGTGRDDLPVIIQPFWKSGFKNPFQIDFTNGWLYGCSTAGPSRSVGEGDEQEADRSWAWPITEYTKNWIMGHMLVRHDPILDAMCYFESAHSLNDSGFWTTRVWCWGLEEQEWVTDILLTSTTHDCIVSGVATVGDHLEFLMGGRTSSDTVEIGTYRFDTGTGPTPWYAVPQFSDSGDSQRKKRLGPGVYASGKITNGQMKFYGAGSGQKIPVNRIEDGTDPLMTIQLNNSGGVIEGARRQINVRGVKLHTARLEGVWDGLGSRDRIEDFSYETDIYGVRQ